MVFLLVVDNDTTTLRCLGLSAVFWANAVCVGVALLLRLDASQLRPPNRRT